MHSSSDESSQPTRSGVINSAAYCNGVRVAVAVMFGMCGLLYCWFRKVGWL